MATKTMKQPTITKPLFDQIYELASPLVKSYRTDLEHDRAFIADNPGLPFLHQTRETGTHIIELRTLDMLPGPGVYVPYLFGTADAEHIARETKTLAECLVAPYALPSLLLLHFDGRKLRKVSREDFIEIATEHTYKLVDQIRARSRGSR